MKQHRCYYPLVLSVLLLVACQQAEEDTNAYDLYCQNPDTAVRITATDYLTGAPVAGQAFWLRFLDGGDVVVVSKKWVTNAEGVAGGRFGHFPYRPLYDLSHLSDSVYFTTEWWQIAGGCDHEINVVLKKAINCALTVRNDAESPVEALSLNFRTLSGLNDLPQSCTHPGFLDWPSVVLPAALAGHSEHSFSFRGLPDEKVEITSRFARAGHLLTQIDTFPVGRDSESITMLIH